MRGWAGRAKGPASGGNEGPGMVTVGLDTTTVVDAGPATHVTISAQQHKLSGQCEGVMCSVCMGEMCGQRVGQ